MPIADDAPHDEPRGVRRVDARPLRARDRVRELPVVAACALVALAAASAPATAHAATEHSNASARRVAGLPAAESAAAAALLRRVEQRFADAADAFAAIERHLRARAPFGAHLSFAAVDLGQPFLVDASGWAVDEALSAMREAWGAEPMQVGVGGSIPFIAQLAETFPAAQVLVTGVEDPHTRAHSPDESLHLGVFQRAILTEAVLLTRLQARVVH